MTGSLDPHRRLRLVLGALAALALATVWIRPGLQADVPVATNRPVSSVLPIPAAPAPSHSVATSRPSGPVVLESPISSEPQTDAPITINGDFVEFYQDGTTSVSLLRRHCVVSQGDVRLSAGTMVLWRSIEESPTLGQPRRERLVVFAEEDARLDSEGQTLSDRALLHEFTTTRDVQFSVRRLVRNDAAMDDPLVRRAVARRDADRSPPDGPQSQTTAYGPPRGTRSARNTLPTARGATAPAAVASTHAAVPHAPVAAAPISGSGRPPIRLGSSSNVPSEPTSTAGPPSGGMLTPSFAADTPGEIRSVQYQAPASGVRRIRIAPRSAVRFNLESFRSQDTVPPEQVWIITGGVNLIVDSDDPRLGLVDLTADRMVIWTQVTAEGSDITTETMQTNDVPFQVYLEGNIVARQGTNVLRAQQGVFDAREYRALLLNAELKARFGDWPFAVRIRADRLRQLSRDNYQAQNAWISTSEYGKPGYRLQASDIFIEPRAEDPWAKSQFDPTPNDQPGDGETLWATSLNNTFLIDDVPLFYWPKLSAPAEDPNIPLRRVQVQNDRILGTQIYTSWNLFKLLGLDRPAGTEWNLNADYFTKRGPQIGTSGNYTGENRWFVPGRYFGSGQASFIYDTGKDNLGADREKLTPEREPRGQVLLRDRQLLPNDLTLQTEIGFLSDRNYLEAFDEASFDAGKDYETLIQLSQQRDNWTWSVLGRPRVNDFYNESSWLPRGDLTVLSEPLFNNWFTWSSRSSAGYADIRIADAPTDPLDRFSVLPYEGNARGEVLTTRHELNAPFSLGPVHVVPYALGEASHWGQDYSGGSLDRLYGSVGVRGSLEFWRPFPELRNSILGLNGLTHKMVFDVDYSYSQATQALSGVPQFNEFDDNAQEQFRRRLLTNTFGGTLPAQLDPRSFAVRSGYGRTVTAPYHELVDDLHVLRLGWRHRLQTRTGPANAPRVKDWMTLDLEASFFPDAERDNFGEDFGVLGARYAWNISDRTTINAGSYWDLFDQGAHVWNVGVASQRSSRGSVYLGYRQVEAGNQRLQSQIVTASYSYVLSPKWISTFSTAYDVGEGQSRGQSFTVTRVGADFLIHFGGVVDPNKNNVGIGISFEPRFAPFAQGGTQLSSLLQAR